MADGSSFASASLASSATLDRQCQRREDVLRGSALRALQKKLDDVEIFAALTARIGAESFKAVKTASGTHDYHVNRRLAAEMLMHWDWVREEELLLSGDAAGAATMARPEWLERADLPLAPPLKFERYVLDLTRAVGEGSLSEKLELLFHLYARSAEGRIAWPEVETLLLHHTSCTGKFARDGPLYNDHLAVALRSSFEERDDGGGVSLEAFLEIWKERWDVAKYVKFDLERLLRHALECDELDRALLKAPFRFVPKALEGKAPRAKRRPAGNGEKRAPAAGPRAAATVGGGAVRGAVAAFAAVSPKAAAPRRSAAPADAAGPSKPSQSSIDFTSDTSTAGPGKPSQRSLGSTSEISTGPGKPSVRSLGSTSEISAGPGKPSVRSFGSTSEISAGPGKPSESNLDS
ncbi:hypothetical protein M885DRAFT_506710, partial [Pelagophyceae sp. CCMP2097]